MNIIKDGVTGIGSTVSKGTAGITKNVKHGMSGIGHTFQDGVQGASHVKDKILFRKKAFDIDDELINIYEGDLKTSIAGLKYLNNQLNHLKKHHWPKFFNKNVKIVELFITLIGENALQFKDIGKYYHQFSQWQAEQVIPSVHPQERQFLIESVCRELNNYLVTMNQLRDQVLVEWDHFQNDVIKPRVQQMIKFLKGILKLLKLRSRKKYEHDKIHKKIAKLMAKTSPLSEKEQSDLVSLEVKLKEAHAKYTKVNDKVKSILPHAISFLDEFVETITKLVICKQYDTYKSIQETLKYFATFHGLSGSKDYQQVNETWKSVIEPARHQIETTIEIIHNKKPELADTEIDTEVAKDSAVSKIWGKAKHTLEKKPPVKPNDMQEGVFNDHQTADPLVSYEKYKNVTMNVAKVYNPGPISIDDVIVPHSLQFASPTYEKQSSLQSIPLTPPSSDDTKQLSLTNDTSPVTTASGASALVHVQATTPGALPPPLPPRSNRPLPVPPVTVSSPRTTHPTPIFSPIFSPPPPTYSAHDSIASPLAGSPVHNSNGSRSNDPLPPPDDDADDDDNYDDDDDHSDSDLTSVSSIQTVSSISDTMFEKSSTEALDRNLVRVYNSGKNAITRSPTEPLDNKYNISPSDHMDQILFEKTTSISYKIWKFNQFFNEFDTSSRYVRNGKEFVAIHGFKGDQPGDLSFKKDDIIKVVFEFTTVERDNWLVAVSEKDGLRRIGFVPSNYLEEKIGETIL